MKISSADICDLSIISQSKILTTFLFYLTITVRDLYASKDSDLIGKLYAINSLYHCVIPFVNHLMFGCESSYTADVVCQNIQDMASTYDMEKQVVTAWGFALRSMDRPDGIVLSRAGAPF